MTSLLALSACKMHKPIVQVPVKTVERKVTTLVPVYIPGDSAIVSAYFECDSLNNVLLKEISEQKSKNIATKFNFSNGELNYSAETKPDTVYISSDTVYIEKEIPLEIEIPLVEYRQTKFQNTFYIIGLIATAIFIVFIITEIKNINFLKFK